MKYILRLAKDSYLGQQDDRVGREQARKFDTKLEALIEASRFPLSTVVPVKIENIIEEMLRHADERRAAMISHTAEIEAKELSNRFASKELT